MSFVRLNGEITGFTRRDGDFVPVSKMLNTRAISKPGKRFTGGAAIGVTFHETANPKPGATARAHAKWQARQGGPKYSWHATVDEKEVVQSLEPWEQGWHAGDGFNGYGNQTTYAIEVCVNGDVKRAWENAIEYWVHLYEERLIGREIYMHHAWKGKDCPALMRNGRVPGISLEDALNGYHKGMMIEGDQEEEEVKEEDETKGPVGFQAAVGDTVNEDIKKLLDIVQTRLAALQEYLTKAGSV